MSKIEVSARMDQIDLSGVQSIRIGDIAADGHGYSRRITITTEVGDFNLVVRAKSEKSVGLQVPAKLTL